MKKFFKICKKVLRFSKNYKQVLGLAPLVRPHWVNPTRSGAVRSDRPNPPPPRLPSAPATPRSPASSPASPGRLRPSPPPWLPLKWPSPLALPFYRGDLILPSSSSLTQPKPKLGFRDGVVCYDVELRYELELNAVLLLAVAWTWDEAVRRDGFLGLQRDGGIDFSHGESNSTSPPLSLSIPLGFIPPVILSSTIAWVIRWLRCFSPLVWVLGFQ